MRFGRYGSYVWNSSGISWNGVAGRLEPETNLTWDFTPYGYTLTKKWSGGIRTMIITIPQYLSDRSLETERNVIGQVESGLVVSLIIIISLSPEGCQEWTWQVPRKPLSQTGRHGHPERTLCPFLCAFPHWCYIMTTKDRTQWDYPEWRSLAEVGFRFCLVCSLCLDKD